MKVKNGIRIKRGNGPTKYGPGLSITLTGNDIARAVDLYLMSQDVHVVGPRTHRYLGQLLMDGYEVYVDPSGRAVAKGREYSGRGG